jgi:hypothetical protein
MSKVVVTDIAPNAQCLGGAGRSHQRQQWRQLFPEVIGDEQRRIAKTLDLARKSGILCGRWGVERTRAKSKGTLGGHGDRSFCSVVLV